MLRLGGSTFINRFFPAKERIITISPVRVKAEGGGLFEVDIGYGVKPKIVEVTEFLVKDRGKRAVWPLKSSKGYYVRGNLRGGDVLVMNNVVAELDATRNDKQTFTSGGLIFSAEKSG